MTRKADNSSGIAQRTIFVALAVLVTFVGDEFPDDGLPNFWFAQDFAGVPLQYPAMIGVVLLVSPIAFASKRFSVVAGLKTISLWTPTVLVWVALGLAIGYGIVSGAPELFADWRNIVVLATLTTLTARWLASRPWRDQIMADLAIGYGVAGLVPLGLWLSGVGGAELFGESVPIFAYPPLFMVMFSSLVCLSLWLNGLSQMSSIRAHTIQLLALTSSFIVLVSFRRAFWAAWLVAFVVLAVYSRLRAGVTTKRLSALLLIVGLLATSVVIYVGADDVRGRLESFVPGAENEYSSTNEDHLNDITEAIGVISEQPLTGLGIGRLYRTPSIAEWKDRSFEVHNAPVHMWLKFGLIGAIAYVWFHVAWIRHQLNPMFSSRSQFAADLGLGAYVVGIFVNTMVQTSVYGSFQMANHLGILLGVAVAVSHRDRRPPTRPSERVRLEAVPSVRSA